MPTSLATQLAQIAAESKSTLNIKAQKAAHSKSLIWEPRVAATQSYQSLYTTCHQGFEELCQLDGRFLRFQSTLFSEESQDQDRTQLTTSENEELDRQVDAFLRLAGSRLRLMPAIKAVEWLIRRFRIHENSTSALVKAFLPYHSMPVFTTLLSILPSRIPQEFRFLDPYIRSLTSPPRSVFVHQAVHHPEFLSLVSEYTLESCRMHFEHPALISFWGGLITEAVSGILDRTRSGRVALQKDNEQALLHRLGPIFAESLVMKKAPSVQIASYMALSVFVSKGGLEDVAVTAFMEQTVHGWTNDTLRPGLVCLAIMAQHRSAKQMSGKVTKALLKISDIGSLLVEIGSERRIDKFANGLCLALIERLSKKGDHRGLPTIMSILNSRILKDRQIAVIFKSLLLTALKLNDENDSEGTLRRELGSTLITLSQTSGDSGEVLQKVIQEVDFDIEELEIKLDVSFRTKRLADSTQDNITNGNATPKQPKDLSASIEELSATDDPVPSCLLPERKDIFDEFCQLFISIVSQRTKDPQLIERFEQTPKLRQQAALKDCTFFSFFIRVWCGPYPALARVAALDAVRRRLRSEDGKSADVQALIPYCLVALADPSKRVRQAAAALISVLGSPDFLLLSKDAETWGARSLYGGSSADFVPLGAEVKARFLQLQILPAIEECVMDPSHVSTIVASLVDTGKYVQPPDPALDKKDHLSQSSRLAVLSSLGSHIVLSPLLLVKDRLLVSLNQVRGVSKTSRTKVLLPALEWWVKLSKEERLEKCGFEKLDSATMDSRFVDIVAANDLAGLEFLISVLKDTSGRQNDSLIQAIFARIRKMWSSLKGDVQYKLAEHLLEISQGLTSNSESDTFVAGEAADFLRTVPLTTDILLFFLDSIKTGTRMATMSPPTKRRRTSSSDGTREIVVQTSPELSHALRRITFVLQLVESSDPVKHPELLGGLFAALSELRDFRAVIGSELGYLQSLILRSLLAIMPAYKANKNLEMSTSDGYGDLLVDCMHHSSSPVVQNSALLLIAGLATTAPSLILHSVMPIFTLMGTSVLRQSDDYSAHVVYQTIKEVVPPVIASLRHGKRSPIAGASDILLSFTTAYEHIPSHRRKDLFSALVETLGASEFLYALIGMLVHRYGPSDALMRFVVDLLNGFTVEIQLETLVKLLDLTSDLLKPRPELATALLGISQESDQKTKEDAALSQLSAYPMFLLSKTLRSQVQDLVELDDMEASEVRSLYAKLLEDILILADKVRGNKDLHTRCGAALSQLLNLLSIGEFIKAVENLIDRPNMGLRQKVLRALEVRIENESNTSVPSRTALLAFLPQLTATIRESADMRYKYTAVTCVDKIAEKYGKKDIEAVVAAASIIASEHCLGQDERQLRVMSLLCLTSLVDVLQDAVVPVLPIALPRVVSYLHESIEAEEPIQDLHSACYGLLSALAQHLPYMLSTYVVRVLEISYISAEAGLKEETNESRVSCLQFLAGRLDAKDMFVTLDKTWERAMAAGYSVSSTENVRCRDHFKTDFSHQAMGEYLTILDLAIDKHPKSTISKNTAVLASISMKVFDLRRRTCTKETSPDALRQVDQIEIKHNEAALKMIYKLNDASFRPLFVQFVEWAGTGLSKGDETGRILRQYTLYGFLCTFFDNLKSIVTNYATYFIDDAMKTLDNVALKSSEGHQLWSRILQTLAKCFEHDQDDFWQAPTHFGAAAPVLMKQFLHAASVDLEVNLIPAVVELAAAADSQTHQKELNSALLKHLKSEQTSVRLAAVKCQQALTSRLGEEWLAMLHEMLPRISELQEDDDEEVERETHRWIVKIEGVLGESLDAMLQ